jgi:hypothetical protein
MIADWEHGAALLAVAGVAGVALLMLFSGARRALRSAGERDARLIAWALLRLGLSAGLWWVWRYPPAAVAFWVGVARPLLPPYGAMIVMALALWLAVTGATRLLLSVPAAGNALRVVTRHRQRNNTAMIPAGGRRSRRPWAVGAALALLAFGAFCFLW